MTAQATDFVQTPPVPEVQNYYSVHQTPKYTEIACVGIYREHWYTSYTKTATDGRLMDISFREGLSEYDAKVDHLRTVAARENPEWTCDCPPDKKGNEKHRAGSVMQCRKCGATYPRGSNG